MRDVGLYLKSMSVFLSLVLFHAFRVCKCWKTKKYDSDDF